MCKKGTYSQLATGINEITRNNHPAHQWDS